MTLTLTMTRNLSTEDLREYTLPPRQAVIAAYAQGTKGDWNTWDYEEKYGELVEFGRRTVICGDWCAMREDES